MTSGSNLLGDSFLQALHIIYRAHVSIRRRLLARLTLLGVLSLRAYEEKSSPVPQPGLMGRPGVLRGRSYFLSPCPYAIVGARVAQWRTQVSGKSSYYPASYVSVSQLLDIRFLIILSA
jgi:hypothetical protein